MTNHWVDIKNADVVLVMGGNAAEAHPVGFKWVIEAKKQNKAKLVVVDPRFTRSASVADFYAPIRTGTDIAFLGGVINYLLTNDKIHHEYVKAYTDFSFLVSSDYSFENGLFSGYNPEKRSYDKTSWSYVKGDDGYVVTDPTLQDPRCVYQLMKQHYSRYTPAMVEKICGTPKDAFLKVCELMASTASGDRTMTILYALGWTQHSQGSQIIRTGAMVQLLLGNIGVAGGGMNALRGHSNIQGLTDLGLMSNLLPGYMTLPSDKEGDYAAYIAKRAPKPLRPNQLSYLQNYEKFHVSFMKSWFGDAATKDNNWAFDYLPKLDKVHDVLQVFDDMYQGKKNGYFCQGFNPLASFPNKAKLGVALSKLKYLVIIDPLATETSEFWRNFGEYNDVDPSKIKTTVFRLPSTCFAEEDGSLVNSGRWLQWHWKGAEAPGEAKPDPAIMAGIFLKLKAMYKEKGGAFPDPILNLTWNYKDPPSLRRKKWRKSTTARHWSICTIRTTRPSCCARRASSSTALRNCAMTARPPAAAGFSAVRGRKPATTWRGATTAIHGATARRSTGPGHGRSIAASCTTAPRPIQVASRSTRSASRYGGTAPRGLAPTCPTSRRTPTRPTAWDRSS